MTYAEISKILIEHHKAYKKAVKLTEKEEELLNDYAADLDMDIEGAFENKEENTGILKKCPFCGNDAKLVYYYEYDVYDRELNMYRDEKLVCIKCMGCNISTKYYKNSDNEIKKAIKNWNSRK